MGSCHYLAAHLPAEFDEGNGQSRTFCRVGARTQFIKQHQSTTVAFRNDIHDGPHMAGEGGQALSNGLLITNIRQNGIKSRQGAAIPCRDVQTTLRHQGQQTDGL